MFRAVGRLVARRPGLVILAWVAAIVGLAVIASAVVGKSSETSQNQTDFLPSKYESVQAAKLANAHFPQPTGARATLVLTRTDHGKISSAEFAQLRRLVGKLDSTSHFDKLAGLDPASLAEAPTRTVAIATAQFTDTSGNSAVISAMKKLRSHTNEIFAGTGYTGKYTGEAAQVADSGAVQQLVVIGTVIAIFILLLLLFRSVVVAAGAVVLMYVVGAVVQMLLSIAAHMWHFKIDDTTTSILPIVLFGVGTDYVVFFMFRYRERLRDGDEHRPAIASAIGRVGEAVSSSAFAVIVSFAALSLSQLKSLKLLGPALALAVLVMLASSLTLIPAVLALTGRRLSRRPSWHRPPRDGIAARVGHWVCRRPGLALAVSLAAFIGLGAAAFGLHSDYRFPEPPSGTESGRAWQTVKAAFPQGVIYPTDVYIRDRAGHRLEAAELATMTKRLRAVPGVGAVGLPTLNQHGDTALVQLQLTEDPSSPAAVDTIRHGLVPLGNSLTDRVTEVKIGGDTMAESDFETALTGDEKLIFPVAGILIGLILVLMLRSLVSPLLFIVSFALGFAATLGASVIVFQGIAGDVGLTGILPIIVYLFVASIGTDYNIVMIARVREELRAGRRPGDAVRVAIQFAGPTVAAAGIVLATSFAILTISSQVRQIGFAVAAGVLISLFLSSWLYVPALTQVLGSKMWWPSRPGPADRGAAPVESLTTVPNAMATSSSVRAWRSE